MDDRRLSTGWWGVSKSKDSALMHLLRAFLGDQVGASARKGGHCFFDTSLDQRIELLEPPQKYGQERIEGRQINQK
jgi:hypothetical protein